ncbi:hypothetical protein TNCV_2691721 [Trichonephila clavipes]|uniref:Uncharacterized protein n=1 Tax=Trichonephila clavipes TaxID=2585209 RepID=A0A8X6VZ13_TRICX|nr:hypothetical protein TNCV_2691721 [Trichonephila clavipes]
MYNGDQMSRSMVGRRGQYKWVQPQNKKRGKSGESRPTFEKRTQQGGPVRARKSRENHFSPYIEEQARSSSKNTGRSSQQQN